MTERRSVIPQNGMRSSGWASAARSAHMQRACSAALSVYRVQSSSMHAVCMARDLRTVALHDHRERENARTQQCEAHTHTELSSSVHRRAA